MRAAGIAAAGTLLVASLVASCTQQPSALDQIRARNEIRVVTLNLPTCYYLSAQGTEGLEYKLAKRFAAELGVRLVMYPVATERAIREEIASGRADMAAAQLTPGPEWLKVGRTSIVYGHVAQLVVYRRDGTRPRGTLQLETAKLAVRAGSPQEQALQKMKKTVAPALKWVVTAPINADPLADVDSGEADYALIDEREFTFAHHLYPNIILGFTLPEERPIQWVVRRDAPDLVTATNRFLQSSRVSAWLANLELEETGDARPFEYEESREFQAHLSERLPRYQSLFQAASAQTGVDWRLLAAIGYQESKWNPVAESGDGALGMMMLTSDTAEEMGITDRTNAAQNISAGARYFASMREKIPDRIPEPDRTWLTVAAYNVGFGHLEDARILAQTRGKNPDSWADVRDQLPLLGKEKWYSLVKRGYARGWEPVQFVDRVQRYLTLLEWQPGEGVAEAPPLPTPAPTPLPSPTGTSIPGAPPGA